MSNEYKNIYKLMSISYVIYIDFTASLQKTCGIASEIGVINWNAYRLNFNYI